MKSYDDDIEIHVLTDAQFLFAVLWLSVRRVVESMQSRLRSTMKMVSMQSSLVMKMQSSLMVKIIRMTCFQQSSYARQQGDEDD